MRYLLLIYLDEQALSDSKREQCYGESIELAHQLKATGQYLDSSPLQPTATATSVRVRDGKPFLTDGPFAETREQLGGYYLVDARNLDDAIGIAGQIPAAKFGVVEIRPLIELTGLPGK